MSAWLNRTLNNLHHDVFDIRHRALHNLVDRYKNGAIQRSDIVASVAYPLIVPSIIQCLDTTIEDVTGAGITPTDNHIETLRSHYRDTLYLLHQLLSNEISAHENLRLTLRKFASQDSTLRLPGNQGTVTIIETGCSADALLLAVTMDDMIGQPRIQPSVSHTLLEKLPPYTVGTVGTQPSSTVPSVDVTTTNELRATLGQARDTIHHNVTNKRTDIFPPTVVTAPVLESSSTTIRTVQDNLTSTTVPSVQPVRVGILESTLRNHDTVTGTVPSSEHSTPTAPWIFPWVALTRADEARIIDLLMLFKAADISLTSSSIGNDHNRILTTEDTLALVPHYSPLAAPYIIFEELFLADYPPEVFLSCPSLLAHLLGGILHSAPYGIRHPLFEASVRTLTVFMEALLESLALRSNVDYLNYIDTKEDTVAYSAAQLLARQEARAAVRDYTLGVSTLQPSVPDVHYGGGGNETTYTRTFRSRRDNDINNTANPLNRTTLHSTFDQGNVGMVGHDSASVPNDSRYATLATVANRLQLQFLQNAQATQPANIERYYGLRYRYPSATVAATDDAYADATAASPDTFFSSTTQSPIASISGTTNLLGQSASLLDNPVPLTRFAVLVIETLFEVCRYTDCMASVLPVLRTALSLAFDPVLSAQPMDTAAVQRIVDTIHETLVAHIDTSVYESVLSSTTPGTLAFTYTDIVQCAETLTKANPSTFQLLSMIAVFFSTLPLDMFRLFGNYPSVTPDTANDDTNTVPAPDGTTSVQGLTQQAKLKIRRAARARASGYVDITSRLILVMVGGLASRTFLHLSSTVYQYLIARIRIMVPSLIETLTIGEQVARDLSILPQALQIAKTVAKTDVYTEPGQVPTPPALRAWTAFLQEFRESTTHLPSLYPLATDASVPTGTDSFSLITRILHCLSYENGIEERTKVCSLVVGAVASLPSPRDNDGYLLADQCLRKLLLHSDPRVRLASYSALSAVLLRMETYPESSPHLSIRNILSGTDGTSGFTIAIFIGTVDRDTTIRTVALQFIAQCVKVYHQYRTAHPHEPVLALPLRTRIALDDLIQRNPGVFTLATFTEDETVPSLNGFPDSLDVSNPLLPSPSTGFPNPWNRQATTVHGNGLTPNVINIQDILYHIEHLFHPSAHQRKIASAEIIRKVTSSKQTDILNRSLAFSPDVEGTVKESLIERTENATAYMIQTEWNHLPNTLLSDPVPFFISLYPDGIEQTSLPEDQRQRLLTLTTGSNGSTTGTSTFDSKEILHPSLLIDWHPQNIQILIQTAIQRNNKVRYDTAVAFAGSQLGQLEATIASSVMPLSVRASTVLQLAHTLLRTAPVPGHIQTRMVTTLDIVVQCTLDILHGNGVYNDSSTEQPNDPYQESGRLIASLALLLDALTATSQDCRDYVLSTYTAQLLLAELMYTGPVIPRMTGITLPLDNFASTSSSSSFASTAAGTQYLDSRLCALRSLTRCAFESTSVFDHPWTFVPVRYPWDSTLPGISSGEETNERTVPSSSAPPRSTVTTVGAEVFIDLVRWNAYPLLRHPLLCQNGSTVLLPVVLVDSLVHQQNIDALATPVSSYIVTQRLQHYKDQIVAVTQQRIDQQIQEVYASLREAKGHTDVLLACRRLRSLCHATPAAGTALMNLPFDPSPSSVSSSSSSSSTVDASSAPADVWIPSSAILQSLYPYLSVAPVNDADYIVHAACIDVVTELLPFTDLTDPSFLFFVRNHILPFFALTTDERTANDTVVAAHLVHVDQTNLNATHATHPLPSTSELVGRTELLIDTLRHSEYTDVVHGYTIDPFGNHGTPVIQSNAALLLSTSNGKEHSIFDANPFTPVRNIQLRSIHTLFTQFCSLAYASSNPVLLTSFYTDLPILIQGCIDFLLHPHSRNHLRLLTLGTLSSVLQYPVVLDYLAQLPTDALPETQIPSTTSPLCIIIRTLIRICHNHQILDSFQHKSLLRASAALLAWLTHYIANDLRNRASNYADTLLSSTVWKDRVSQSFGWLARLTIDREASVRIFAYSCLTGLFTSSLCHEALLQDTALPDIINSCIRHATGTVIADTQKETGFLGSTLTRNRSVIDSWDAEVPAVRAACADVLAAYVKSGRLVRSHVFTPYRNNSTVPATAPLSPIEDLIQRDVPERIRTCLRQGYHLQATSQLASLCRLLYAFAESVTLTIAEIQTAANSVGWKAPPSYDNVPGSQILALTLNDITIRETLIQLSNVALPEYTTQQGETTNELLTNLHTAIRQCFNRPSLSMQLYRARNTLVAWFYEQGMGTVYQQMYTSLLNVRTAVYRLFRIYLSSHLEKVIPLPLRLRRYHVQNGLLSAIHTLRLTSTTVKEPFDLPITLPTNDISGTIENCQFEACQYLTAVIDAWSLSTQTSTNVHHGHPLFELLHLYSSSSLSSTVPGDTGSADKPRPNGGSPGRHSTVSSSSSSASSASSASVTDRNDTLLSSQELLATIIPNLLQFIQRPQNSLALRVAAGRTCGALAWSSSRIPSSIKDPFGFCRTVNDAPLANVSVNLPYDNTYISHIARSMVALLLSLSDESIVNAEEERWNAGDDTTGGNGDQRTATVNDQSTVTSKPPTGKGKKTTIDPNNSTVGNDDQDMNISVINEESSAVTSSAIPQPSANGISLNESLVTISTVRGPASVSDIRTLGDANSVHGPVTNVPRSLLPSTVPPTPTSTPTPFSPTPSVRQTVRTNKPSLASSLSMSATTVGRTTPAKAVSLASRTTRIQNRTIPLGRSIVPPRVPGGTANGRFKTTVSLVGPSDLSVPSRAVQHTLTGSVQPSTTPGAILLTTYATEALRLRQCGIDNSLAGKLNLLLPSPFDASIGTYNDTATNYRSNDEPENSQTVLYDQAVPFLFKQLRELILPSTVSTNAVRDRLNANQTPSGNGYVAIAGYATTMSAACATKSSVAASLIALLECDHTIGSSIHPLTTVGSIAADALASEGYGIAPLHRLLRYFNEVCSQCTMIEASVATEAIQPVQALLGINQAVADAVTLLKILAALFLPRTEDSSVAPDTVATSVLGTIRHSIQNTNRKLRSILVAALELQIGPLLARSLTSFAAVARCAFLTTMPETIKTTALAGFRAAVDVAINFCGCHDDCASALATHAPALTSTVYASQRVRRAFYSGIGTASRSGSFLDIVVGEALQVCETIIGNYSPLKGAPLIHNGANAGLLTSILATESTNGKGTTKTSGQLSSDTIARFVIQLHNGLFTCLMGAAHRSSICRQLIVARGIPTVLVDACLRRLQSLPSYSYPNMKTLPLPALTCEIRLLAGIALPGDNEGCTAIMRIPNLAELMVLLLGLELLPEHQHTHRYTPKTEENSKGFTTNGVQRSLIETYIADLRVAATTVLANIASRKGSEDLWLSRETLIKHSLQVCQDNTIGVRAAAADMVRNLCKNTVRIRSVMRKEKGLDILTKALQQTQLLIFRLQANKEMTLPRTMMNENGSPTDDVAMIPFEDQRSNEAYTLLDRSRLCLQEAIKNLELGTNNHSTVVSK